MNLIPRYLSSLLITLFLSSCLTISKNDQLLPSETPPQTPTLSSPTKTQASLPVLTATLMPPATLEAEKATKYMASILQEPIDCLAPCFWGITPNQTTLAEAKNIFAHLGLSLDYVNKKGDLEFYSARVYFDTGLSVAPDVVIQNDIVKSLTVGVSPSLQGSGSRKEWFAYSPATLISQYGVPAKVNFDVDRGMNPGYGIAMFFDSVDLAAYYSADGLGAGLQICPLLDQVDYIDLSMGENSGYLLEPDRVPLDKAASLSIEEFSALMTGKPEDACFTLNSNMFP